MKHTAKRGLRERMEELSVPLLAFLAADVERMHRFFALTGLDPTSLRAASRSNDLTLSLWSYLAGDEEMLLAFAAEQGLPPAAVSELALAACPRSEDG